MFPSTLGILHGVDFIQQMVDEDFKLTFDYKSPFSTKSEEKIEKLCYLENNLFEAVDYTRMDVVKEITSKTPLFIKGEKYSLKGVACDGFDMPEKVYELVGVVDEFDGIKIDSVIVKQLSGDKDQIYTLSKIDCDYLNIEFENGLQLFPKTLNWERVKDQVPFEKNDLGTTPLSDVDHTIRYVLLKIDGFKDYSDGYIVTPNGKLIKEKHFLDSLKIMNNEPIVYGNNFVINDKSKLNYKIVSPKGTIFNHGNFISSDGFIYVLINLGQRIFSNDSFGVKREYLKGISPNEKFLICWDELGAYTIEEYELEKAKKEKIKQEKIAAEEAKRKKLIEQEEKKIKERREKVSNIINEIKKHEITLPQFPKMEKFNDNNGISSSKLFIDAIDAYLDNVNLSLNNITKNVDIQLKILGVKTKIDSKSLLDLIKL